MAGPDRLLCDFCSSSEVVAAYEAPDFDLGPGVAPHGVSIGGWAACATCRELIEKNDQSGLTVRSMWTAGLSSAAFYNLLAEFHRRFLDLKTGRIDFDDWRS